SNSSSSNSNSVNGAANHAPFFTKGNDQIVLEDCGPQKVTHWATGISAGSASEQEQSLKFIITTDNPGLFSSGPAVSSDGTLTYTPAGDANGMATVTVKLQDNGGTVRGGVDTSPPQTFRITVTPVNDAPSFLKAGDVTVLEDSGPKAIANWAQNI